MSTVCPTCSKEFDDSGGFCPFDGTPLVLLLTDREVRPGSQSDGDDYVSLLEMPSTTAAMAAFEADAGPSVYEQMIGTTLDDRYTIERILGEGGMGVVFLARHRLIDKPVAIKVLRTEVASDSEIVARFIREARSASSVGHPNIVEFTDFGTTPEGLSYSVMEYVEGPTLDQLVTAEPPMSVERAFAIASQLAEALAAAHDKGIVHRDLKPENIFVFDRDGRRDVVKIVDFGIAKVNPLGRPVGPRLTAAGTVFGTPEYMSPEQAAGQSDIDHRSDVYSLGVILYEMLTGQVPHRGAQMMRTLAMKMLDPVKPMSEIRPDLRFTEAHESLLQVALTKKPEDRIQSMRDFQVALELAAADAGLGGENAATVMDLGHADEVMRYHERRMATEAAAREPAVDMESLTATAAVSGIENADSGAPPRRRTGLMAALFVLVALAGVGLGVLLSGGASEEPSNAASTGPEDETNGVAKTAGTAVGTPSAAVTAPAAGQATSGERDGVAGASKTGPDGTPTRDTEARAPADRGQPAVAVVVSPGPDERPRDRDDQSRSVKRPKKQPKRKRRVKIITQPEGARLYIDHNYSGKGGTTLEREEGTELTVECRLEGHRAGRVQVRFDGESEVYLCLPKRASKCVDGLKNPFDSCS